MGGDQSRRRLGAQDRNCTGNARLSGTAWETGATVRARDVKMNFEGVRFTVDSEGGSFPVHSPLVGRMNVYNILAAVSAGISYGFRLR